MSKHKSAAAAGAKKKQRQGVAIILGVCVVLALVGYVYVQVVSGQRVLDKVTLCPPDPDSIAVLIVDVTDPMNVAQRQDFLNQLEALRSSIPRFGKLSVFKVDATGDHLLRPVITRCNPGTADQVSSTTGNPTAVQRQWEEGFKTPLDRAFETLLQASSAERSPILESIQSVALTELQRPGEAEKPRKLIVASDLLQNTDQISFYRELPPPAEFTSGAAFRTVRTDLRGVDVQLWMLQRPDAADTQPRALPDLWDAIISKQGGQLSRLYTVSG